MAESIQGIKVSALPEATQEQLTDASVTIVDDGTTTRKTKLSTLVAWLKNKIIKNTLTQASAGYALDAYQGKLLKDEIDKLNSAMDKYIIIIDAESEKATIPPHQGKRFSAPKIIKEGYDFLGIINAFPNGDASIICYTSEWAYNVNDTSRTISVTYQLAFIKKL